MAEEKRRSKHRDTESEQEASRQKSLKRKQPVNSMSSGTEIDVNDIFNAESNEQSSVSGVLLDSTKKKKLAVSTDRNGGQLKVNRTSKAKNKTLSSAGKPKRKAKALPKLNPKTIPTSDTSIQTKIAKTPSSIVAKKNIPHTETSLYVSSKSINSCTTATPPAASNDFASQPENLESTFHNIFPDELVESYDYNPFAQLLRRPSQYISPQPTSSYMALDSHQTPPTNSNFLKSLPILDCIFILFYSRESVPTDP